MARPKSTCASWAHFISNSVSPKNNASFTSTCASEQIYKRGSGFGFGFLTSSIVTT